MFKIFSSCLILFWLSCPYLMIGQDRHDNYWVLGDLDKPPAPYQSRVVLNFNSGKPEFQVLNHKAHMFECNVMSDIQGKLQFYHDGCHLYHHGYEIMDGGYMLNPGYDHDRYCGPEQRYPYYPLRNGSVTIPDPFQDNLYHLIHLSRDENLQIGILYHSRIDMSLNNGYGKLVEKVKVSERLSYTDGIQAIRHGNGRDWWIISKGHGNDLFYRHLWTPEGFKGPYEQKIGIPWDFRFTLNHSAFSPDGQWYGICNAVSGAHLFRFDRCTGELSTHLQLKYPPLDSFFSPVGMCFSPDSRLLYVSAGFDLVQYRVDTSDILASYSLVDSIDLDAKVSKLYPFFYMMLIAPDGKIYMNTTNSTEVFHVIHQPNLRGPACDFRQNDLVLPVIMYQNLPNFPHYRTYDWDGSGCDTLGITGPVSTQDLYNKDLRALGFVMWNQDHYLQIKADQQVLELEIINLQGQNVFYKKVEESEFEIPVYNLLSGIYIVKLYFKDHTTSFAKFVKD